MSPFYPWRSVEMKKNPSSCRAVGAAGVRWDDDDDRPANRSADGWRNLLRKRVRIMRITYLTTDELNRELAEQAGKACGVDLDVSLPRPSRTPDPSAATVYDLDHLGDENSRAVLEGLLSGRSPAPVAVHSYNLQDEDVVALRSRGVVVARRIEPEVIQRLCRVAGSPPTLNPAEDGHASEPEEDDAGAIGAQVRSLASAAYRVLPRESGRPSAVAPDAIAQVLEQLDRLQRRIGRLQQLHSLRLGELQRWASNLRRLIEEHV
jgi:hypothetical protein